MTAIHHLRPLCRAKRTNCNHSHYLLHTFVISFLSWQPCLYLQFTIALAHSHQSHLFLYPFLCRSPFRLSLLRRNSEAAFSRRSATTQSILERKTSLRDSSCGSADDAISLISERAAASSSKETVC